MNNIEEKIKKEFQQREIQPSVTAWDNLSKKLEQSESNKKNKFAIFIRIAAVFIGLLFAVSFFLKNNHKASSIDETKNTVVRTDDKKNIQIINNVNKNTKQTNIKKDEVITNANVKKIKNNKIINNKKSNILLENTTQQQIVKRSKPLNLKHKKTINRLVVLKEEQKNIAQITKPITNMPSQNERLTLVQQNNTTKQLMNSSDDDIENMLAKALKNNKQRSFKIKIEDKKLQYAAEQTLNTSLKYKVYKTIKTGVNSVIVYNKNKNQ